MNEQIPNMSKGKRDLVYEGYALPKLTIKELLASNARKNSELKNFHKQMDKEKEELVSDFSKTRSHLLSRAHDLLLEGQAHDLSEYQSDSDEEQIRAIANGSTFDALGTSSWETTLFSTPKNLSSSQVADDACTRSERNLRHKQQWADKVAYFEQSAAVKTEPVSSKTLPRRKISWAGRTNPVDNWDARSDMSKASSEGNLSSERATCAISNASRLRVRRHTVARSSSFNPKSTTLTKEALQTHSSSTSKLARKQRRHTVCTRGNFDTKPLTPTEEEQNCPVKKPLSDLLPPIKLPPIYLQESKGKQEGKKCDKNFVNTRVRVGVSKSLDATHATEDLHYCRYLRIKRMDDNEFV